MFVLPTLLFPLVFGLAVFRLYQIPRKLWRGELRLPGKQRLALLIATIGAYFTLLVYTIALTSRCAHLLFFTVDQAPAYIELFAYLAAYPLVNFGAAWIFYYGLRTNLPAARPNFGAQGAPQNPEGK